MLTASLAASVAARPVPALRPVPSSRFDLEWAFTQTDDLKPTDIDLPEHVSEDAESSVWFLNLWIEDEIDLILTFKVMPVYETGVIDGSIGERHVTREVTVCTAVKTELTRVSLVDSECEVESLDAEQVYAVRENWPEFLNELVAGPVRQCLIAHYE